ncbi:Uncharacterised protein [Vibrio cholerae]|nr:Uncharacterised protein [Vibrio cholerae]
MKIKVNTKMPIIGASRQYSVAISLLWWRWAVFSVDRVSFIVLSSLILSRPRLTSIDI